VSDAVAYFLNRPEEKLVGRQLEEIFDAGTALGAAVLAASRSGEEVSAEGVMLEDGRQVQFSLDRIDDGLGGQSMGTLVTLRDTETVMQLGQELEVARRLAAIGSLTAGVGHEVKNPINAMVVHLELLRSKLKAEGTESFTGAHRHVEILTNEMQRLDRVVQTLADFSRPMELKLREQDLRHVVNAVVELTAAELQGNGVQVVVDAPFVPVMVRVDAELIRQALLNLLLNAMQAMPGGGTVRVALRREHPFAVLEVHDDGVGIPPEVLPRIFELYFTTKPKGSGIGLAMTYRILQLHGGALDVRSNADPGARDHGTTFTLRLPIAAGQAAETRKAFADPAGASVIVAGASRKGTGE
jgi:signal transduction histidine kinase